MEEIKKRLRRYCRSVRKGIDPTAGSRIAESFIGSEIFRRARVIFTYVSVGTEADTRSIINAALGSGKTVAVPVCDTSSHSMTFHRIGSLDCLVAGAYGIPVPDGTPIAENADICIVPGLAFSPDGSRLGYGGGYYDRFLSAHSMTKVGLCAEALIFDRLPCESTDIPVDMIFTEHRIYEVK